jgi:ferric-dicitrate binding protein FerR (iron transport regulator)
MTENTLQSLFKKYLDETISPEEFSNLNYLIEHEYDPEVVNEVLKASFSDTPFAVNTTDHDLREVFAGIIARIRERKTEHRLPWGRITAAACIFLLAGIMIWIWMRKPATQDIAMSHPTGTHDIPPGHDGAVLTLADGRQIVLDSLSNGSLAVQGNATVSKLSSGQLRYTIAGDAPSATYFNKLSTPRARRSMVVLADGTRVWLNAASSIRYPTVFTGKERLVEVSGEVYFEVAQDPSTPFVVKREGADQRVEVLGTSFNMNAYDDEDTMRTTLIEGSIKVIKGLNSIVLKPGEQAAAGKGDGNMRIIRESDIEEAIAWKNGRFQFSNMDMKTIMRELERWYDVDVEFQGDVPDIRIGGSIHKDMNLSTVLEFLKGNGVRLKFEDKKITILK